MTKKSRFGSFVAAPSTNAEPVPEETPTPMLATAFPPAPAPGIPAAPQREDRKAFSTRVRPSQKAALDTFVMDLKRAGWPVSQEAVLEELLRLLQDDSQVRATITSRLTRF